MAVSREEIIEALKEMSLLEASELVKDLDECDSFLLVIIGGVISAGMRGEVEHISRTGKRGCLIAMSQAEAEKLIGGGETDGTDRYKHRPACGLFCRKICYIIRYFDSHALSFE